MRTLLICLCLFSIGWAQGEPDISIDASVKAKSVKFDQVPTVRVTFPGHGQRDTRWTGTRHNLPTPVKPGVTYRNVEAKTSIRSHFKDILSELQSQPHEP